MKRKAKEGFEAYRERRRKTQKRIKQYLQGRWFYNNDKHSVGSVLSRKYVPYENTNKNEGKISLTQQLRNQKGYQSTLVGRFNP